MHNILTHFLINNVFQDLIRTKNSRNISLRPYCLISRALNKLRMAQSASSRWVFVRWEGRGGWELRFLCIIFLTQFCNIRSKE